MATQTEVARHLSLTDRQLRRLQKLPGALISNKRGQLDLDAWRDFYISYLRRSKTMCLMAIAKTTMRRNCLLPDGN